MLPELLVLDGGASYCLDGGAGTPVGFGQYWPRPDGAVHLLRIIVSPGHRGAGLGRELCRRLIAMALEAPGATSVTLNVYPDNPAAVCLYQSLGFREDESRSRGDSLFMRLAASRVQDVRTP
jgi:ribosomal protein S18 acetylase RimI-like enzyme